MSMAGVYLCDEDRLYLGRLHSYLRERIRLPLKWREYTSASLLPADAQKTENAVLVIGETQADPAILRMYKAVMILTEGADYERAECLPEKRITGRGALSDETGFTQNVPTVVYAGRYQRATVIAEQLLELLTLLDGNLAARRARTDGTCHVAAYYSPLGRCMQTSMALASGQILSTRGRALYVGFDTFPVSALAGESMNGDITDLLYYAGVAREKLPVYLEKIKRRIGGLEYIPPAPSVYRAQGADGREMIRLLQAICEDDRPDVLLLDLSEHAPGLTDLLSYADEVITITGHDSRDSEKMEGYRRWLAGNGMEHVLEKTRFCKLPSQCRLPPSPERLMTSALGTYIKKKGLLPGTAKAAEG